MDAQKFGRSVGQFFKKIDRTLSFLPEKPRKAVIATTALAVSPVLAGIVIAQAKTSKHVNNESADLNSSLLLTDSPSISTSKEDGEWEHGFSGFGYYVDGIKVCGYDDEHE